MAGTAAKYAFATLAVTAKVHRLLDKVGSQQARQREQTFDDNLTSTLRELEQHEEPPAQRDTRHDELSSIKRDFDKVEQLYKGYKKHEHLPETVAQRFDRIFSDIREKIRQKELAL
jgi:hypothetical protein